MTLINDCACIETGECLCDEACMNGEAPLCECACDNCEDENVMCGCGGNCRCQDNDLNFEE